MSNLGLSSAHGSAEGLFLVCTRSLEVPLTNPKLDGIKINAVIRNKAGTYTQDC